MSIVPGRDVPAVPDEWVDAVNKAINDENHLDLCACDGWPDACRSYKPGLWDLGEASLHIAISVLAPFMRAKESARGDHWKRVAMEIEQDRDRLAAEIAQLPICGRSPSDLVEKIGFGTPCHLHQGHTGLCRYRQRDVEYVNHVLKACGYEADAQVEGPS